MSEFMGIAQRYELEKALHSITPDSPIDERNKLEVSGSETFYGEVNEDGSRKSGILRLDKPCGPLPAGALFVGTFGRDGRPLDGEYRSPGVRLKISPISDSEDRFNLTETFVEGGVVIRSTCGKDLTEIERQSRTFSDPTRSPLPDNMTELFAETKAEFKKLHAEKGKVFDGLEEEMKEILQPLRESLASRELLLSDTMLSELTGRTSEKQKETHKHLRNGIINRRIDEHEKDPAQEGYGSGDQYGNCLQYAQQAQKIAVENGLPNTFILFGHPDHVFNVVAKEDKMFLVDSWNGDLMCEFTPKSFYEHSSLHAIFDLTIHRSSWAENGGCLDPKNIEVQLAQKELQERIQEVANARFDPEIQEIINGRVSEKLKVLDPKDDYYQENRQELLFITDYFGLEELDRKLQEETFLVKTGSISNAESLNIEESLDLAVPKKVEEQKEKSWVEKMEDKKLSNLKGGVREL